MLTSLSRKRGTVMQTEPVPLLQKINAIKSLSLRRGHVHILSQSKSQYNIHTFHSIQNGTSAVRIVAAKSYEADVHSAVKDAIVFFHAPW